MADNGKGGDSTNTDDSRPDKGSQSDSPESLKQQVEALTAERDEWKGKHDEVGFNLRKVQKDLADLKKTTTSRERDNAEGKGDLENYKKQTQTMLDEKDAEIATLSSKLKSNTLQQAFRAKRDEFRDEQAFSDAWSLIGSQIDLSEDGKVIVKDSPESFDKFVSKFLEARPYLAANKQKSGGGTNGPGDGKTNSSYTRDQLLAMSDAEYSAAVRKDPSIAKVYAGVK